jgi:hypothetical protein
MKKERFNYSISGICKSGEASTTADIEHFDKTFIPKRLIIYKNGLFFKELEIKPS